MKTWIFFMLCLFTKLSYATTFSAAEPNDKNSVILTNLWGVTAYYSGQWRFGYNVNAIIYKNNTYTANLGMTKTYALIPGKIKEKDSITNVSDIKMMIDPDPNFDDIANDVNPGFNNTKNPKNIYFQVTYNDGTKYVFTQNIYTNSVLQSASFQQDQAPIYTAKVTITNQYSASTRISCSITYQGMVLPPNAVAPSLYDTSDVTQNIAPNMYYTFDVTKNNSLSVTYDDTWLNTPYTYNGQDDHKLKLVCYSPYPQPTNTNPSPLPACYAFKDLGYLTSKQPANFAAILTSDCKLQ